MLQQIVMFLNMIAYILRNMNKDVGWIHQGLLMTLAGENLEADLL